MKKIISAISAAALLLTCVSCSSKGSDKSEDNNPITQTELLSFKEASVEIGVKFNRIISLDKSDDKIMILGESASGEYLVYITNKNFSESKTVRIILKDNEEINSACLDKSGDIAVLTVLNGETFIYAYDSDGNISAEKNLGEADDESEYGATLYSTDSGYYINYGNEYIAVFDNDMNYIGNVDVDSNQILSCCKDVNWNLAVISESKNGMELAIINGTELTDTVNCNNMDSTLFALCAGNSEYTVVGNFADGIYGFNGSEWVKITDYKDNSFNAYSVLNMLVIDNEYLVANGNLITLLSERDISEIKVRKTVTLASFYAENTNYSDLIKKFNAQNDEYKIEVVAYEHDYKSEDAAKITQEREQKTQELKLDIVSGKSPDLITDFIPGLDPSVYYYDLFEFLEHDADLNTDDFIPGLLDGISIKGKIPVLFPTFSLDTLMGKTKFAGEKENISYDDLIEIYNSLPDDMQFISMQDKNEMSSVFMSLVNYENFIDFNNGTCWFDSPDYIKMMTFIKDNHIGLSQSEFENYIQNLGVMYSYDDLSLRNDKVVFGGRIDSPEMAVQTIHAVFGESVTFVGNPSADGIGSRISPKPYILSIMRNAKEPEGAWEFIKFALLNDDNSDYFFSVLEDKFKEQIEKTKNITHIEDDGKEYPGGRYNYYFDRNTNKWSYIDYDSFTQDEADRLENYVRQSVKSMSWYDKNIAPIIFEELDEYFNSDRTAEKTAEMIQNRMSIYMSENYG